jgi:hypothetical protein
VSSEGDGRKGTDEPLREKTTEAAARLPRMSTIASIGSAAAAVAAAAAAADLPFSTTCWW